MYLTMTLQKRYTEQSYIMMQILYNLHHGKIENSLQNFASGKRILIRVILVENFPGRQENFRFKLYY
jgi:hypothetical protein